MKKQNSILIWIIFITIAIILALICTISCNNLFQKFHHIKAQIITSNMTSATALNYVQRKNNLLKGVSIKNCKDVVNIFGIHLPPFSKIIDQPVAADDLISCTLIIADEKLSFDVIGIN